MAWKLVELQPGQPDDGQPVDDPALLAGPRTLGRNASSSRGRVKGILWMTREGVSEGDGGDPVLGREGEGSLSSHCPDAEELSNRVEHHLLLVHHLHRKG